MIRLLVADDHSILRKGLKNILELERDITVAGEASNGAEVLLRIKEDAFDLLLMDMTMDGMSGQDLIKRVKAINETLPILVLSMHKVPSVAIHALRAGAAGYITKDSDPECLLSAIRKVAGGAKYIDPVLAEDIAYNTAFPEQSLPHGELSSRELEVFRLLVEGQSLNEIAQRLHLSNKTISTYKTRIMLKMDFDNLAELFRYAVDHDIAR